MALRKGKVHARGVIVGTWGLNVAISNWPEVVYDVREALEQHHGMVFGLDNNKYVVSGPLPYNVRSGVNTSSGAGVIVRIINGAGRLLFGTETVHVDYGDWAFIPAGVDFELVGSVIEGMHLRYATIRVMK